MDPAQVAALLNGLGVAGPLVGFLIWSLRENTKERQEITRNFLTALQTTINTATANQGQLAQLVADVVSALQMHDRASSAEHASSLQALELVRERLHTVAEHMARIESVTFIQHQKNEKQGGKRV